MARKLQLVSEMADQTARSITRDAGGWKQYLDTASRLYKYKFDEQLLIYAQRPDATACAGMELWNEKMSRWVKAGSKGIALIRGTENGRPHLEYVFDVADTRPVRGARMPYLWEMREEHHAPVLAALERRYGEGKEKELGNRLMETAAKAVTEAYPEYLKELACDAEGSFPEELDQLNLEVCFRDTLTASVQYTLLTRCGLNASDYMEDGELAGITEFSTPAVLHHLGNAASTLSMEILQEIGKVIRNYDREMIEGRQKNIQKTAEKPLEKSTDVDYTKAAGQFSTLKRESEEGRENHGRTGIHEERRLSDTGADAGRGGRTGGNADREVRDAAPDLPDGKPSGDIYINAADGAADTPLTADRRTGTGTGRADGGRNDEAERGGREPERTRSDGVGAGSQQPDSAGGGSGASGDRIPVEREKKDKEKEQETAGDEPAVSAPEYFQMSLFPTVEEQVERIARAKEEEKKAVSPAQAGKPVQEVPKGVIGRALTSGGNEKNSTMRIIAFYQKSPTTEAAAAFLRKEYGTGGKGLAIAGEKYALWFDEEGIKIAPGRTANVPGATLVTWEQAAEQVSELLEEGIYATQETLDAARGNEYQELAAKLWYLRQDLNGVAAKGGFLFHISKLYGGFQDSTKKIAGLLEEKESRDIFVSELAEFVEEYEADRDLMRFHFHDPQAVLNGLTNLGIETKQFHSVEGSPPAKSSFITEDEIDWMLTRGSGVSEGKMRIYSYFMQGHDAKERVDFLKNEYGDGGHGGIGYDEWHDSKGIRITRSDEASGFKGYDTVKMNWNQVQERIGELINAGRYLSPKEMAYTSEYEKIQLARSIYAFYYYCPNTPNPSNSATWDVDAAERDFKPMLDDAKLSAALYEDMVESFAAVAPGESRSYGIMQRAIEDMGAYQRGEYSLFTPLPEETLRAERQKQEAAKKEAKEKQNTVKKEKEPVGELEAAARALAKKQKGKVKERADGQLVFDFTVSNTEDAEQTEEAHTMQDSTDMEEAKRLIEDFCLEEYNQDSVDFSNPEEIGVAYGVTENGGFEVRVNADLIHFSLSQFVDGVCVEKRQYDSLRELIDGELAFLDYDQLIYLEPDIEERLEADLNEKIRWEEMQGAREGVTPTEWGDAGREEAESPDMVEIEGGQLITKGPLEVYDVGLPYEIGIQKLHIGPERNNFHITDDELGTGGQKTKYQNNLAAIRILKQVEAENRLATPEEQEILSRYVGWGGLHQAFDEGNEKWGKEYAELKELLTPAEYESARSTVLNAHYTSPVVIKAMYEAVKRMGFTPGNILEPSCGIGNFFGLVPEGFEKSNLYGVELDSLTGRIAKQLYQKADITVGGFETTDHPNDFFDLAVGNVPFGEYKVHDKQYDRQNLFIHDYFLTKTLDKVRPGGVVAFITSKGTMDKANGKVREALAQKADLLGAVRLPNNAFKANAGTDVTADILFFQKRGSAPEKLPDWVNVGTTEDGVPLNNYFIQNPDMVLGRMAFWENMYGNATETACIPLEGADLKEQLAEAVTHIGAPDHELLHMDAPEQAGGEKEETIPADPRVRNFSFTEKGGKLYFRENSRMKRMEVGKMPAARIRGMIAIRDSARQLIDLQLSGAEDEEIGKEQAKLNTLYDDFQKKYGLLNSAGNRLAFRQDSSYPLLCSLEILDEEGNLKRKTDMFTKRTIQHRQSVTSVDTAVEALGVSIGERACVDLGFMASLMGGGDKIPQIISDLKGIIFKDPESGPAAISEENTDWYKGWQTADEYLSGEVRKKLEKANKAAEEHPEFAPNVEALLAVQPKDLTAPEISVRIGAPWIDTKYYRQFLFELLQTPGRLRNGRIDVLYSDVTGEWRIKGKSEDSITNTRVHTTYGTKRINAYEIFEASLNQRSAQIFDTHRDVEGKEIRVLNEKETAIAQQKQDAMKEAFHDWIFKDPERRTDLCAVYNRMFNSTRPREYDGKHINFIGMNPEIKLEAHQRNAVARILYGGNTLLAHVVGAGKTFEMIAAAMEGKRLGLCKKSIMVVPNHLTEQWGGDFLTLYPGAKVLVASKKDFEPKNRKKFCARIATGDYDAVIIGHSQFEKIPISPERQEAIIQGQIDEIVDAIAEAKANKEEKFTVKQMEKTKKNLEAKIKKLYDKKKDDTVTFEELGVDRLFVDEAHAFKNLYMHTKMRNVAGISQTDAQKSSDMFAKCRYMDEITGGRGVVFATGTPVSNSMVELYTMMRYLQYNMLEEGYQDSTGKIRSLKHFDNWAATFGEQVTAVELKPEGTGFRLKTRFARFYNLPELMNRWKEAADIQTADMLKLPVPEAEYITIQTEPSEAQKAMVKSLADRAEKIRREKIDPRIDNMLKITSDGRKLALDQRIMNPLLPDDPGSKVNACVDNVFKIWQENMETKGTQLIFSDLSTPKGKAEPKKEETKEGAEADGEAAATEEETAMEASVYEDIRKKLIAKGIPPQEIAFIHDANTETQKAELFAKVRNGQVRVLLGSTQKMGAGTNVQTRLVASHDLDCPWRPADLEQRAGRIVRRGNENSHVKIYRYVTKGTFDAYTWGLVESKQKFIGQIMTSKSPARSIEDVDATALSYAEVKMLATGDVRIKEKMDLDIQVTKLKMLKSNQQAQQYEMQDKVRGYYPNKIKETQLYIDCLDADLPILEAHPVKEDAFSMTVMGTIYTERKEAGKAIVAACRLMDDPGKEIELGEFRGFPMKLMFDGAKFKVTMKQHLTHTAELSDDVVGNITRINNALEKIPQSLERHKENMERLHRELESAKEEAERPFAQEAELLEKSARLAELNTVLDNEEKGHGGEPAREPEEDAARGSGKPSILKTLKEYERPVPVLSGTERGQEREAI